MTDVTGGGGRPPYEPTEDARERVREMVSCGIPQESIARVLKISEPTLRKYFWDEIHSGAIEANVKVAKSLFDKAMGPGKEGVTAAIFWLKVRAGWRENDPEVGKKERIEAESKTAIGGTAWESLLN